MHCSSESIGAIAAALAKAQGELTNPEKSLVATIRSPFPREGAHHLKFAQPKTLGLKISDEFTVPLCREHHHELHRHGNEVAWWTNLQIVPLETAKALWQVSPVHR